MLRYFAEQEFCRTTASLLYQILSSLLIPRQIRKDTRCSITYQNLISVPSPRTIPEKDSKCLTNPNNLEISMKNRGLKLASSSSGLLISTNTIAEKTEKTRKKDALCAI